MVKRLQLVIVYGNETVLKLKSKVHFLTLKSQACVIIMIDIKV